MFNHHTFTLVGLNDATEPQFSAEIIQAIKTHRVFAGGTRHKALVKPLLPINATWLTIKAPISEVLDDLENQPGPVLVFASGDPLFYGFGATLQRRFPHANFRYYPTFNSLQLLAHQVGLPYQNMVSVSVTGRPWHGLDSALIRSEGLIGVLTDKYKTPDSIARRLLTYGFLEYEMIVGESLGGQSQNIHTCTLQHAANMRFQDLNCVILKQTARPNRVFGISEKAFKGLAGRPNMITKMPFRLVSLSQLGLKSAETFFDIGFCTGSVSVEARLSFPHLHITAFEKRLECETLISENTRQFQAPGIRVIMEDFLTTDLKLALHPFTHLDAAFIGGHGGKIHDIFKRLEPLQKTGARVVLNAVQPTSSRLFQTAAKTFGYALQEPLNISLDSHNPITILTAEKI